MEAATGRNTILLALLGIAAFGAYYIYRGARPVQEPAALLPQEPGPGHSSKSPSPFRRAMAGLAYVDLHRSELSKEKSTADYAQEFNNDPDRIMQEIQKRIQLVPYEGSLSGPARLFESGLANTLDRAQLLLALLKSSGLEARIVYTNQDGKSAFAKYLETTVSKFPVPKPETLDALNRETQGLSPAILAKLKKSGEAKSWAANAMGTRGERQLYWVQVRRSEKWIDLIPEDLAITESSRLNAQVLSPEGLSSLVWQVKLTVANSFDGSAEQQPVLSFSAAAPDLNGVALTFFNQPDDSQAQFIACLFYGEKKITGTGFPLNRDKQELDHQLLWIDVAGPYETRHFERTLVGPKGAASPSERLLELAVLSRITVLTTSLSDNQFKRSIVPNLIQSARLVFGNADETKSEAPLANFVSATAIAVLDGSHRVAGRVGEAAQHVLAFQGRPAVAMERDFVEVSGDSLRRIHSFDLVDPGHSLYGPNIPKDTLMLAAIEQSVVDAWIEEQVTSGKNIITSRRALRELIASDVSLNVNHLPAGMGGDKYGASTPSYRLGPASPGMVAGWRLDPGPQVVPVLGNYTGGTAAEEASAARTEQLCKALPVLLVLVPAEAFPQKFLASGLVKYDCKLAETYRKVASILDGVGQMISGEKKPGEDLGTDDLEKQITELGPDLLTNVLLGALGQSAAALGVHTALGEGPEEHGTMEGVLHYLANSGAELGAEHAAERVKECLEEIREHRAEGKPEERLEREAANEFPLR